MLCGNILFFFFFHHDTYSDVNTRNLLNTQQPSNVIHSLLTQHVGCSRAKLSCKVLCVCIFIHPNPPRPGEITCTYVNTPKSDRRYGFAYMSITRNNDYTLVYDHCTSSFTPEHVKLFRAFQHCHTMIFNVYRILLLISYYLMF